MKAICFYFQIHQPFRLKRYRFFDIGNDHYYYDDFANDDIITRIAHRSYIPAAETLLRMIENSDGKFRCAFSITGTALEQCEQYVPEFIDILKKLADTGKVEFLAETYAHSLSRLSTLKSLQSRYAYMTKRYMSCSASIRRCSATPSLYIATRWRL